MGASDQDDWRLRKTRVMLPKRNVALVDLLLTLPTIRPWQLQQHRSPDAHGDSYAVETSVYKVGEDSDGFVDVHG